MGFTDAVRTVLSRYAEFEGRATRPEFWWYALFYVLVQLAGGLLDAALFPNTVFGVVGEPRRARAAAADPRRDGAPAARHRSLRLVAARRTRPRSRAVRADLVLRAARYARDEPLRSAARPGARGRHLRALIAAIVPPIAIPSLAGTERSARPDVASSDAASSDTARPDTARDDDEGFRVANARQLHDTDR